MLMALLFSFLTVVGWWFVFTTYPTAAIATTARRRLLPQQPTRGFSIRLSFTHRLPELFRRPQKQIAIDFLDRIVRQLRSGNSLSSAVQQSAESMANRQHVESGDFRDLARRITRGLPLSQSLHHFHSTTKNDLHRRAGRAVEMAVNCGGSTSRVLDDVAESLRSQLAVEQEAKALSAQAKISAIVLALSPIGFSAFISLLHPSFLGILFGTTIGWLCLIGGCVFDLVGMLWMRQLLRRAS